MGSPGVAPFLGGVFASRIRDRTLRGRFSLSTDSSRNEERRPTFAALFPGNHTGIRLPG